VSPWLRAAAIVAATLVAYLPALGAGFVWDDDDYVTKNPLLHASDGLARIWFSADAPSQYFPLVYTSFRLEYALWGLDPFGYHLVNVCLHAANALLAWAVLARLAVPGAWLAAAIFALHPVHVESVAWITERKNTLSTLFFLGALLAWLRFALDGAGKRWWAASFGLYALALFAKTTACTLPAAQLLALWLRGRAIDARRVAQLAPFLLLGVAMGMFTILWERLHQGTRGERFELGFVESALVAGRAVWFYLGKLVLPVRLSFSYPKFEIDPGDPRAWVWLALGALLLLALWGARGRLGRGPLAAALFFVAMLSPVLGFIPLYTFLYTYVADHYQYVASLGPIALAAGAGVRAFRGRRGGAVVALGLLATLGVLTWRQSRVYESSETLWRDVIAKHPGSWMAYTNLGRERMREERWAEAIPWFEGALRIDPGLARPHLGIGSAYLELGRREEAEAELRLAVAADPDLRPARERLARLRERAGDLDGAIEQWREVVRIAPTSARGHEGLARTLAARGRTAEAERHAAEARRLRAPRAP
jgi:tetratricopeptide (TPR) repeat protein